MTDLEHDLATAADRIPLGPGDVDKVMALGRHRRSRRQRAFGAVTAVALVAGVVTLVNADRDVPTAVGAQDGMSRGDAALKWQVLSSTDGLGMGSDVNGAGPFYALSTAPGQADVGKQRPSRVLWRSDDGVEWTAATTLGNDLFLSDLAPSDGRVYAVGTAPAQAGVKRRGDLVAGWSDDGGKTFSKKVLPVDWSGIEGHSTTAELLNTQIASSSKGTVVTATIAAALDVPHLLPGGATAPDGWATTANGVDVLGPEKATTPCPAGMSSARDAKAVDAAGGKRVMTGEQPDTRPKSREVEAEWCFANGAKGEGVMVSPQEARGVVRSYTWSDLGVTGDLLGAASHQLFGFFAPSGSDDFTRVDLGGVRADSNFLDADASGFHVLTSIGGNGNTPVDTTDLHSADGASWTSVNGPSDLRWVTAAGTVGGRRVIVGDSGNGSVVARSDGAGGWTVAPLSSVIDPSLSNGRPVYALAAGIGPLGIVVAAMPDAGASDSSTAPPTLLVFSRDGATWEDSPVDKIAGHAVGSPIHVVVSGQRAVVSLSGGSTPEGQAPKPQTILVGTPA